MKLAPILAVCECGLVCVCFVLRVHIFHCLDEIYVKLPDASPPKNEYIHAVVQWGRGVCVCVCFIVRATTLWQQYSTQRV